MEKEVKKIIDTEGTTATTVPSDSSNGVKFLSPEEVEALEAKPTNTDKPVEELKPDEIKKDVTNVDDKDYILNKDGDALNEDGTVFKTKAELEALKEISVEEEEAEDKIDIDGTIYNLDEKGNAVLDGKIVHTADEILKMGEEVEPAINIKNIIETTGIATSDDPNFTYENTEEGTAQYVTDVYKKGNKEGVDNLYKTYPAIEELVTHLRLGGTINDFNSTSKYTDVKLDKENLDQLKDIISTARQSRGDRREATDRYLKLIIEGDTDNDEVYKEAELELDYLKSVEAAKSEAKALKLQEQEQKKIQEANEFWGVTVDNKGRTVDLNVKNSIYNIIKTGKLDVNGTTIDIPAKLKIVENNKAKYVDRNEFFEYLYQPITVNLNGQPIQTTADQLKLYQEEQSKTNHNSVYDALRRFVNYDDAQIIKEKVNKENVRKIKKLTTNKSRTSTNTVVKKPRIV